MKRVFEKLSDNTLFTCSVQLKESIVRNWDTGEEIFEYSVGQNHFKDGKNTKSKNLSFTEFEEASLEFQNLCDSCLKNEYKESEAGYSLMLQKQLAKISESEPKEVQFDFLEVGWNGVQQLYSAIGSIKSCRTLELINYYDNEYSDLSELPNLDCLKIEFSMNCKKTPEGISSINSKIKKLELDVRRVEIIENDKIPLGVESLKIKGDIEDLHGNFENHKNLKELCVIQNGLKKVPPSICEIENLESFQFSSYESVAFPQQAKVFKSLKKLHWEGQEISSEAISSLAKLEKLTLEKIPEHVFYLPNLRVLKTNGSYRSEVKFPHSMPENSNLEVLSITRMNMEEFPEQILDLKNIQELDLSKNSLESVPDELFELPRLKTLDLKYNDLEELPESFIKNDTLENINVSMNSLDIGSRAQETDVNELKKLMQQYYLVQKYCDPGNLTKDVTISGDDVPEEKDRKKIVARYSDRYKKFFREANYYFKDLEPQIKKFIFGEIHSIEMDLDESRSSSAVEVEEMFRLLADVSEWSFVDERIIAIMTIPFHWFWEKPDDEGNVKMHGVANELFTWFASRIKEMDSNENAFPILVKVLSRFGVSEELIIKLALRKCGDVLLNSQDNPGSVGRYILDKASEENVTQMWEVAKRWKWSGDFLYLFIIHKSTVIQSVLESAKDELVKEKENQKVCISYFPLLRLCQIDSAAYKPFVLKSFTEIKNCNSCKVRLLDIFLRFYSEEKEKIFTLIDQVLENYSKEMNEKEGHHNLIFRSDWWDQDGLEILFKEILSRYGSEIYPKVKKFIEDTRVLSLNHVQIAVDAIGSDASSLVLEAINMKDNNHKVYVEHFRRLFDILYINELDLKPYLNVLEEKFLCENLEVAELMAPVLAREFGYGLAYKKGCTLFEKAKKEDRLRGLFLLRQVNDGKSNEYLLNHLENEKLLDVRENLFEFFGAQVQTNQKETYLNRAEFAKQSKWLNKDVKKWISVKTLPELYWVNGEKVTPDLTQYILYRQNRLGQFAIDPEISGVYPLIDKKKSAAFAKRVLQLVMQNGGPCAQNRFACVVVAMLGDDSIVDLFTNSIYKNQSTVAVEMLGMMATNKAILELRSVVKAFAVKYPNVRKVAEEAISLALEKRSLNSGELFEEIVPSYGFVKHRKKLSSVENHEVTISPDFKWNTILPDGKFRKSLIKGISTEESKRLKDLLKKIKEDSKDYISDYEMDMVNNRRWSLDQFERVFTGNILLHNVGRSILWGVYEGNKLIECFGFNEKMKFLNNENKSLEILENQSIGIPHPLEIEEGELRNWKEFWKKKKLPQQNFEQLERNVYSSDDIQGISTKIMRMFDGATVESSELKWKFLKRKWRRGSVIDCGQVSSYHKIFSQYGIQVILKLAGMPVTGYWDSVDVELTEFFFVKDGSVAFGSYVYDEPRHERDQRLIDLGDVPPKVLSEVMSDLFYFRD